jgi:RNA polymerase sigma factor (sigma-70 family)
MNKIYAAMMKEAVERNISQLTPREQVVLTMRFGLTGEDPATLKRVAEQVGTTIEGVRQIEIRALKRLKGMA